MTVEQLGSIGELIGALLVLITLIYLSLQVRTQNAIAKADGHRDLIKQLASLTRRIIDEDLSDLIVQGWLDFDSLTHVEKNRVDNFLHEYLHICEQAFYMGRDKYVPAGSYDAFMAAAASFISPPGIRAWWERSRVGGYAQDFVADIEALRDQSQVPMPWEILPNFKYSYDYLQATGLETGHA
jgi:hypothetical protein